MAASSSELLDGRQRLFVGAAVVLTGVVLTFLFWGSLWTGGGLIGGDIYTYYLPQKQFFAERLAAGELPYWNNRAGHGYPLVGESQTAPFYPPNLLLYRLCAVNAAYNAVQISHYILAFVFTWMYVRHLGISTWGSTLAGIVYTYGWFPPRICLEWAIIGGAWLPFALWCIEKYFETRFWRYWIWMTVALAMQMLAGHFNIAFLTQLTLAIYIPARLWVFRSPAFSEKPGFSPTGPTRPGSQWGVLFVLYFAIALSFALAAIQLVPTWELKQLSQRAAVGDAHHPGYGHLPVWYWSQVVVPWLWYPEDIDLNRAIPEGSAQTNQIEAHLYFGLVPLALLLFGLCTVVHKNRLLWLWLALGVAALVYTPGWFVTLMEHVPGFSFFAGPGRYGIITTVAVAVLSAAAMDRLVLGGSESKQSGLLGKAGLLTMQRKILIAVILATTTFDLWLVCRVWVYGETVRYATVVSDPPIKHLGESEVKKILAAHDGPVRLLCRMPNLPTLLGVASTPPYLGIGPAAYYDPQTIIPGGAPFDKPATPEQVSWLQRAGVTHVLSFNDLDLNAWPASLLWRGDDVFLNHAWARQAPLYLYALQGSRGRVAWESPQPNDTARVTDYHANKVTVEGSSAAGGVLILTDLDYPGWQVRVDGQPTESMTVEQMYRGVRLPAGNHTIEWTYRPHSVFVGAIASVCTLAMLLTIGHIRFWHPQLWKKSTKQVK